MSYQEFCCCDVYIIAFICTLISNAPLWLTSQIQSWVRVHTFCTVSRISYWDNYLSRWCTLAVSCSESHNEKQLAINGIPFIKNLLDPGYARALMWLRPCMTLHVFVTLWENDRNWLMQGCEATLTEVKCQQWLCLQTGCCTYVHVEVSVLQNYQLLTSCEWMNGWMNECEVLQRCYWQGRLKYRQVLSDTVSFCVILL